MTDRPALDPLADRLHLMLRGMGYYPPATRKIAENAAAEARRYFEERLGREALTRLIVDMLFGESNKFEPNESEYRLADAIRALVEPK